MENNYAECYTICLNGLETQKITVQAHIALGMPVFNIVGLGDKAVAESKERIRAAINSIGFSLPAKRITINLSPADLQKEGSHYDLPITIALMAALKIFNDNDLDKYIICGELSLDSSINSTASILPAAISATKLNKGIICSRQNLHEALISGNKNVITANNLSEIIDFLKGIRQIDPIAPKRFSVTATTKDFAEVKGQRIAKRALEIAAAGRHNILMIGPPGSGKSMLSERFTSILPDLTEKEILEILMIKSITGELRNSELNISYPYRSPHHSASLVSLVGGGKKISPGEITKAHNGVLFLDELPEFKRDTIESLRQPIESKKILLSRANYSAEFPADFQLISAMNPCKCGYLQIEKKRCNKAPICATDYIKRISGPMFERIDIVINLPYEKPDLFEKQEVANENSAIIKSRVSRARKKQREFLAQFKLESNSQIPLKLFETKIKIEDEAKTLLKQAENKYHLSLRSINKVLKLAKTISDLDNKEIITKKHIFESLNYRFNF